VKPIRVEILNADGQWQELEGVTDIEFHQEPTLAEQIAYAEAERVRMAQAVLAEFAAAYVAAMRQAASNAAQGLATFAEALRTPIDQDGKQVRPHTARPAWQSPYGPPTRRH
jgi:hypothetical protein